MRLLVGPVLLVLAGTVCATAEPYVEKLKGKHELWEDFEGGKVCKVTLGHEPTIGGFAFKGDARCMKAFKFTGDAYAWHVGSDGWLAITDATRRTLVRFKPHKDGSFYADRSADGLDNLNLTRE
jgi:hypothetical protein